MFKKTIKNTTILTSGTFVSRILGFIRDILVANFFGTSGLLEAFLVAFRLPNLFRSIFAEGFVDAVATPVLSEHRKDKDRLFELGNRMITVVTGAMILFTAIGILLSKYLVMVIAPGFVSDPYKFQLAVSFTRITFFYLVLIGFAANSMAMLCALKKFFVFSINPAFLNISFIVGVIFFHKYLQDYILVVCVLVAGVLQVLFPLISLRRIGFRLKFHLRKALADSEIVKMGKLFVPRIWASIVYHLSVLIDTAFSSLSAIVGAGALAAVYYANRIIQFPFALIALSISRVAVVDLSSYHKEGNIDNFKKLFVFSFQNIFFFIVPVVSLFIFLSGPIIDVLFKRGEFDAYSLAQTSQALFFYAMGLFFFCLVKLLVHSFYALKDTATPAKTASVSLIVNIVLSAILMFPLGIGGVALGSGLAALFNCLLLYRILHRRIGAIDWEKTKQQALKITLLSLGTGAICRLLWNILELNRYAKMAITLIFATVIFFSIGYILHLKQIRYLKEIITKKH
jgi:putative peptidoglycan lipid II flippase